MNDELVRITDSTRVVEVVTVVKCLLMLIPPLHVVEVHVATPATNKVLGTLNRTTFSL